jgi:hypothetical protein
MEKTGRSTQRKLTGLSQITCQFLSRTVVLTTPRLMSETWLMALVDINPTTKRSRPREKYIW